VEKAVRKQALSIPAPMPTGKTDDDDESGEGEE